MIFDTHAHYDDEKYDGDREELFKTMREAGVDRIVNVGADIASSKNSIKLSESHDFIYAAVGVHPSDTEHLTDEDMDFMKKSAALDKVVAIGEIGLDYYWDEPDREIQKKWFIRQLEIARETSLPVIIHSRDAAEDTLEIMRAQKTEEIGGVIHCFSYSPEMAKIYIDMGFYIGVGGVVTFKNAKKLKEVVADIPLERIVLETDAPYLTAEPFRGKRNASHYIKYVAETIAQIKNVDVKDVYEITTKNAEKLYEI